MDKEDIPKVKAYTPKTNVPDTKAISNLLKQNRGKIALGAIGVGAVKAFLDNEDDELGTTVEKSVKSAALISGISYGAEHLFKTETVQDLVRGEVSDVNKSVRLKVDAERMIKAGNKAGHFLRTKGAVGLAGFTLLDLAERGMDHHSATELKAQEEYDIKLREKQKKKKQQQYAYGHIDQGEIVFDLFNQRTGHYKMGNAKFN